MAKKVTTWKTLIIGATYVGLDPQWPQKFSVE